MSEIRISPRRIVGVVTAIAAALFILHLLNHAVVALGIRDRLSFILNIDNEDGLFDAFSAGVLLVCSFLLGCIAAGRRFDKPTRWAWAGLSLIFFGLATDEAASMHDIVMEHLRNLLGVSDFLLAWVVPYGILLVALALLYVRFVWQLPRETRARFVLAGILYISGAMGCDMVGGYWLHGVESGLFFHVLVTVEEVFEISGTILFVYALTDYIRLHIPDLCLRIG